MRKKESAKTFYFSFERHAIVPFNRMKRLFVIPKLGEATRCESCAISELPKAVSGRRRTLQIRRYVIMCCSHAF
jgi:hypothetical protein